MSLPPAQRSDTVDTVSAQPTSRRSTGRRFFGRWRHTRRPPQEPEEGPLAKPVAVPTAKPVAAPQAEPVAAPQAEPVAIWSELGSLSSSTADSRSPTVASALDGTVHVLWEEGEEIYHSYRSDDFWSTPLRVATGERPSLVVDDEGTPHVLFANEFGGNWEVYYVSWRYDVWSLPRNVSHTSGASGPPRIALAPDGTLHGVWADTTPGYSVIYYARQMGSYWVNNQIPSARGSVPALAVDRQGRVHVTWQAQDTPFSVFDVYYTRWDGSDWSLPENISVNEESHSAICSLATDTEGTAYLVWEEQVEGLWQVVHSYGQVGYWSVPANISHSGEECHLPRIVVTPQDYLHVIWNEGQALHSCRKGAKSSDWFPNEVVTSNSLGVEDVAVAASPGGGLHAVWEGRVAGGLRDIFHGERPPALRHEVFVPLTMRKA